MGTIQENVSDQSGEASKQKTGNKENALMKLGNTSKQYHTSMSSLITWNVSKALERKPCMDLKSGIRTAQERLQRVSHDGNTTISHYPEEEHLVCALLAWQQLGHNRADSLYEFIISKRSCENQDNIKSLNTVIVTSNSFNIKCNDTKSLKKVDSLKFGSYVNGPVIKLPVETKVIMRMDQSSRNCKPKCTNCKIPQGSPQPSCSGRRPESKLSLRGNNSKFSTKSSDTTHKIDAACCMDSACTEKLSKMDAETAELKSRAEKLAKREALRSELLERAEAAWKDLERGYQRRLTLSQEKEADITRQIEKTMEDRNQFKEACNKLAKELKDRGDAAEKDRAALKSVEGEVCCLACTRLKLNEEMTHIEAALAEQQCKTVQLQRDLQFKEEQVRRRVKTMESETESARALTHETERAMRAELSGLREQINDVSNQLLEEDKTNTELKKELEDLRREKVGMIEDLDGCKAMCDGKIKAQMDDLLAKKKQLQELKEKELECRCKLPVDVSVEVKRSPSLAAVCQCSPENKLTNSCSCTSMKGRILSNLLEDLFGGLQSELTGASSQMPCQLLKCLEDDHNWDRASVTKSNLRDYFSKLLVGELDIAIATSIENYHAKWVGTSCADTKPKVIPGPEDEDLEEGWEKRAIERRAQKLAAQLAEELYEQRAEELTKRAKIIVTSGPPPCECKSKSPQCTYTCLVDLVTPFSAKPLENVSSESQSDQSQSSPTQGYWKRTHHDVTQLRLEIEDLKKASIKKKDLKLMEEKITKIVQKTAETETLDVATTDNTINQNKIKKETNHTKNTYSQFKNPLTSTNRAGVPRKKSVDTHNLPKKSYLQDKPTKQPKKYNYHQTYAVNMCLCTPPKPDKITHNHQSNIDAKASIKQKPSNKISARAANDNQIKLVDKNHLPPDSNKVGQILPESYCDNDCKCFNKVPSNSSIDNLLETLTKWKSDLDKSRNEISKDDVMNISKSGLNKNSKNILKNQIQIDLRTSHCLNQNNNEVAEGRINKKKIEVLKQNHSTHFHEAIKTVSEYIAAVNLDKSNDYASKTVNTIESFKGVKKLEKNAINRCLHSFDGINLADQKNTVLKGDNLKPESKNILNEHLYDKVNNTTKINILSNSKSTRAINTQASHTKEVVLKDTVNEKNIIPNHANILSNNLDYYVKFLGVTLVDTKSQKNKNSVKNCHDKPALPEDVYKNHNKEVSKLGRSKFGITKSETSTSSRDVTDSPNKVRKCECKAKFEEFKKFIMSILDEQIKSKHAEYKDIALDSQSLTYQFDTLGSCVCCNKKHVDCSKDLELNAFQLLEAHLKEKIKEFKICSCQSSCISAEEEEKIFRTILNRVKQVISDCANELKCNESGSLLATSKGSWQRAYGLLQEYLKMKVKRAQCLPLLNDDKDTVLPDILEKVCELIETDFQRLKDLCKCDKNTKLFTKVPLIEPLSEPHKKSSKKDIGSKKNVTNTIKTVSRDTHIKPIICTKNVSSQVRSDIGMESKSCDARSDIEMETKSCDAMIKNKDVVNPVSTQNSTNALIQSILSQDPLDLGRLTKPHSVKFKNDVENAKDNLPESMHVKPQKNMRCQQTPNIEVDTKSCDAMIAANKIIKLASKVNIPKSNNDLQHFSSQISSNLTMENKYCDAMVNNLGIITAESPESFFLQSCGVTKRASGKKNIERVATTGIARDLIYNTCDCNYKKPSDLDTHIKPVLYNFCTGFQMNSCVNKWHQGKEGTQVNILSNTISLPNIKNIETMQMENLTSMENRRNNVNIQHNINSFQPFNSNLSKFESSTCMKTIINDEASNIWKEFLSKGYECTKNFQNIMKGKQNQNDDTNTMFYNLPVYKDDQNNRNSTCKAENICTMHSNEMLAKTQHSTYGCESDSSLVNDSNYKSQYNWEICSQPTSSQTRSTTVKCSKSSFYYEPVNESISFCKNLTITKPLPSIDNMTDSIYYEPILPSTCFHKSETTTDTSHCIKLSQNNCKCDKVPLCHVKMLVENIERNLIESKCTCDSLFKICPVHRKKVC